VKGPARSFQVRNAGTLATAILLAASFCALFLPVPAAAEDGQALQPRWVPAKPDHSQLWPGLRENLIIVKFREGSGVRLREGRLVSLAAHDLAAANELLAARSDRDLARLFHRSEAELEADRLRAQQRSGKEMADLNNYYQVTLRQASRPAAEALLEALNDLPVVEIAYAEPIPEPAVLRGDAARGPHAAAAAGLRTPDYTPQQLYLNPAPTGIDAGVAWFYPGGRGETVKVIDIETGFNWSHEDMQAPFFEGGSTGYSDHGIAVTGEICATDNGFGVTGIANQVQIGGYGVWGVPTAAAFDGAAAALDPGDIFVIELHCPGPRATGSGQFGFIAMEWWQANYDVITLATANGVICCEAAGNGEQDFDDPIYEGKFDRNLRDSGAIIVGATDGESLEPAWFTNFGTRVDLSGWGADVVTTGYGDLHGGDPDEYYTASFGGTSSATPIVTGAVAAMQGIHKASFGAPLSGNTIAQILRETGTPQEGTRLIGPRPNLAAAIPVLLGGLATITGTVTDAGSGLPIEGAEVRVLETGTRDTTAPDGSYSLPISAGSWTVRTEVFGYATDDSPAVTTAGGTTVVNVALSTLPTVTVNGVVRDEAYTLLAGAEVTFAGTPLPAAISGPDGSYEIPGVPVDLTGLVVATAGTLAPDAREVTVTDPPPLVNFRLATAEDFELPGGGGFTGTGDWEWGTPSYVEGPDAHSGLSCWGTNLDGDYSTDNHRLTSPAYDLTDTSDPRLSFWHWFSIWGPYDGINVSISLDGTNYSVIEPVGGYPDSYIYMLDGQPGWTNNSDGWVPAVFDLSAYIGQTVRFRFGFGIWAGGTPGWYIDDLAVHSATPSTPVASEPRFQTYLKAPWPTPAAGRVTIAWGMARPGPVTMQVYDVAGRKVRTLLDEPVPAGEHRFAWNGEDDRGRRVGQGVYFVRLRFATDAGAEAGVLTRKVVLVR